MLRNKSLKSTKINLKLYDIDGCLYHAFKKHENAPPHDWLIESNKHFLESQINEIKKANYQKIVIAYGTNRQDKMIDDWNANRGGSCAPALPSLQVFFSSNLQCNVVLDPFLMADIYGNPANGGEKIAGDSYRAILRSHYGTAKDIKHSQSVFDEDKISLIYAHIHRISTLHPNSKIVIDFYDDSERILTTLESFFKTLEQKLLPKNTSLRLHMYKGEKTTQQCEIHGKGEVDNKYEWTVRYMASQTFYYSWESALKDNNLQTAQHLKDYHDKNIYFGPGHQMKMSVISNYYPFKFLNYPAQLEKVRKKFPKIIVKFRDKEIKKLPSNFSTQNHYTTVKELLNENLLPPNIYFKKEKNNKDVNCNLNSTDTTSSKAEINENDTSAINPEDFLILNTELNALTKKEEIKLYIDTLNYEKKILASKFTTLFFDSRKIDLLQLKVNKLTQILESNSFKEDLNIDTVLNEINKNTLELSNAKSETSIFSPEVEIRLSK